MKIQITVDGKENLYQSIDFDTDELPCKRESQNGTITIARQSKGSAEQQSGEAPVQQLKAEIWPIYSEGMEYLLRGDSVKALEFFNKVTAKLSAV